MRGIAILEDNDKIFKNIYIIIIYYYFFLSNIKIKKKKKNVKRKNRWVAIHPNGWPATPRGPHDPPAWPSGGCVTTPRAIGGGQDHPLMGFRTILIGSRRGSLGVARHP
jgi:hypothetical protein